MKKKILTLAVVTIFCAIAITITIQLAWFLAVIFEN